MALSKKGGMDWYSNWSEIIFLVLLFVGIVFGIFSPSAVITYLIGFFSGAMSGRLMWERKEKFKAPYLLIVIGFVIGYVIGTFHGDRRITFLLFVFGAVLTYYLYDRGLLKDITI